HPLEFREGAPPHPHRTSQRTPYPPTPAGLAVQTFPALARVRTPFCPSRNASSSNAPVRASSGCRPAPASARPLDRPSPTKNILRNRSIFSPTRVHSAHFRSVGFRLSTYFGTEAYSRPPASTPLTSGASVFGYAPTSKPKHILARPRSNPF